MLVPVPLPPVNVRARSAPERTQITPARAGTSVAIPRRMFRSLVLASALMFAAGCGYQNGGVESQDQSAPYENFNEENYSNVPSYGEGSSTPQGYYGTGSQPEEAPDRTPASPRARPAYRGH